MGGALELASSSNERQTLYQRRLALGRGSSLRACRSYLAHRRHTDIDVATLPERKAHHLGPHDEQSSRRGARTPPKVPTEISASPSDLTTESPPDRAGGAVLDIGSTSSPPPSFFVPRSPMGLSPQTLGSSLGSQNDVKPSNRSEHTSATTPSEHRLASITQVRPKLTARLGISFEDDETTSGLPFPTLPQPTTSSTLSRSTPGYDIDGDTPAGFVFQPTPPSDPRPHRSTSFLASQLRSLSARNGGHASATSVSYPISTPPTPHNTTATATHRRHLRQASSMSSLKRAKDKTSEWWKRTVTSPATAVQKLRRQASWRDVMRRGPRADDESHVEFSRTDTVDAKRRSQRRSKSRDGDSDSIEVLIEEEETWASENHYGSAAAKVQYIGHEPPVAALRRVGRAFPDHGTNQHRGVRPTKSWHCSSDLPSYSSPATSLSIRDSSDSRRTILHHQGRLAWPDAMGPMNAAAEGSTAIARNAWTAVSTGSDRPHGSHGPYGGVTGARERRGTRSRSRSPAPQYSPTPVHTELHTDRSSEETSISARWSRAATGRGSAESCADADLGAPVNDTSMPSADMRSMFVSTVVQLDAEPVTSQVAVANSGQLAQESTKQEAVAASTSARPRRTVREQHGPGTLNPARTPGSIGKMEARSEAQIDQPTKLTRGFRPHETSTVTSATAQQSQTAARKHVTETGRSSSSVTACVDSQAAKLVSVHQSSQSLSASDTRVSCSDLGYLSDIRSMRHSSLAESFVTAMAASSSSLLLDDSLLAEPTAKPCDEDISSEIGLEAAEEVARSHILAWRTTTPVTEAQQ